MIEVEPPNNIFLYKKNLNRMGKTARLYDMKSPNEYDRPTFKHNKT